MYVYVYMYKYIYIYVYIYMYVYIYIPINLVGGFNPSEKYIVSWDEYSQLNGNIKFMFQTQTINGLMSIPYHGQSNY